MGSEPWTVDFDMYHRSSERANRDFAARRDGYQGRVVAPLVPDTLRLLIEPSLPVNPAKPKGGRPRVGSRAALTGILFVLRTGIPWEMLPQEMGCGSDVTCWRRLRHWHAGGVWDALHRELLRRLHRADCAFLAAYNAGPDRVDAYLNGSTMLPDETVNYVAAIGPAIGMQSSFGAGANADPPPLSLIWHAT